MFPPSGKMTLHGSVENFPYNSPFIKFAILPKKIPIGAAQQMRSVNLKKLFFVLMVF